MDMLDVLCHLLARTRNGAPPDVGVNVGYGDPPLPVAVDEGMRKAVYAGERTCLFQAALESLAQLGQS
jgi:hypothetical protein